MPAPTLTPEAQAKLDARLAEIDAVFDAAKAVRTQAWAIVDAAIPAPTGPQPHGFYEREDFIARSIVRGNRAKLFRETAKKLADAARIAKEVEREAEMQERAA